MTHTEGTYAALAERLTRQLDETRTALADLLSAAEWYRRCLEDVQDGRRVTGLAEAKAGYDDAMLKAAGLLARDPSAGFATGGVVPPGSGDWPGERR